jgi:threonine aldolase
VINLYSDTQTRPSEGMRRAIYEAEVADEQRKRDPTVNALQERVAELLGKEAALFLPSGTMCNAISFRLHIDKGGDEAILHEHAHPIVAEAGGPAAISGAMMKPLAAAGGIFSAEQVEQAIRPPDRYMPRSRLVSVEQTTNMGGGRVWPQEKLRAVVGVAKRHDLRTHLDGARLMNAVVASGVPAARHADGFDTAWVDFTKGLGAGVGACMAASADLIEQAWRYKQMWGGSLRQAGFVAAGCLYALDHNVERLAEDHANARLLANGLAAIRDLRGPGRREADRRPGGRGRAEPGGRPAACPRGDPHGRDPRRGREGARGHRTGRSLASPAWPRYVMSAGRVPRSGTAAHTRWLPRGAASIPTCRRSAYWSAEHPGANTCVRAASRPARSPRLSEPPPDGVLGRPCAEHHDLPASLSATGFALKLVGSAV